MARSLTVSHEETLRVNWLFTGFLLLAVAWIVAATVLASPEAEAQPADAVISPS